MDIVILVPKVVPSFLSQLSDDGIFHWHRGFVIHPAIGVFNLVETYFRQTGSNQIGIISPKGPGSKTHKESVKSPTS